jgi:hypothetical protein
MAATAQRAIVPSRLPRQLDTACLEYFQLEQLPLDISCDRLIAHALEHLAENQISETKALSIELRIKPVGLRIPDAMKVIDPDSSVDDNHARLLRNATQAGCFQIAFPSHVASQAPNARLSLGLYQQPQRFLDNGTLR